MQHARQDVHVPAFGHELGEVAGQEGAPVCAALLAEPGPGRGDDVLPLQQHTAQAGHGTQDLCQQLPVAAGHVHDHADAGPVDDRRDRAEHGGARLHGLVEDRVPRRVPGEVREVVGTEVVQEGVLPGPHGVQQPAEGRVERAAVDQGQRPHRMPGVGAQQLAEAGQGVHVVVRAVRAGQQPERGEVVQEAVEAVGVGAGAEREVGHGGGAAGVGGEPVEDTELGADRDGLRLPGAGHELQQRPGGLVAHHRPVCGQGGGPVAGDQQLKACVRGSGGGGGAEVQHRDVLVRVVAPAVGSHAGPLDQQEAQSREDDLVGGGDGEGDVRLVALRALAPDEVAQACTRLGPGHAVGDAVGSGAGRHGKAEDLDLAQSPVRGGDGGPDDRHVQLVRP